MENKIIDIIEKVTNYRNLRENLEIDLLESEILDSLAFIELITELEDEFDIEIQVTQAPSDTWKNVKNIQNYVEKIKK